MKVGMFLNPLKSLDINNKLNMLQLDNKFTPYIFTWIYQEFQVIMFDFN